MANPSLQIGNSNWAIKEDNLLGYSTAGTRFVPQPITMTRASAGTRVNSSGLVETVELLGSEEIDCGNFECASPESVWSTGTGWDISGGSASSDGTASFSSLSQASVLTIGKFYKLVVDINLTSGQLRIQQGGTILETYTTTGTNTATYYFTATATNITFKTSVTPFNGSIDNVSVKESTKNNLARVDYDGTASSLLVEPQRTNVNTYSEDFSQSFYIKDSGVSVGTTNNVSPSGESNALQIEVDNNGRIYANVASDTYASSVFIKAGTFAYFKFGGNVDLVAGTFSGGTIESFGNGWFKITKQYTGNRPFQIQAYPDGTYSSHTTTGDYYIWGSQIEAGSYATSYIPTDGGTVTRVQDLYSKTGISNLINSEEGVLFVEIASLSESGNYRELGLSDGTTSNRVLISYKSTDNVIRGSFQGSGGTNLEYTVTSSKDFHKIAVKWKVNDFALWVDGVEVGSDTSGSSFPADTLNSLSLDDGGGASKFLGKVKQLQVFKTALTDTELATLTTI